MIFLALSFTKLGILSKRFSASSVQIISFSSVRNNPSLCLTRVVLICSKGSGGTVLPPRLTPKALTSCVSWGLVRRAILFWHLGHIKVTDRNSSSDPSALTNSIPSSHSIQRYFILFP